MVMRVSVSVSVMVIMPMTPSAQNEHTGAIHNKPKYRDKYGLVKHYLNGIDYSQYTFKTHKYCKNCQQIAPVKPPKAFTLPVPKL